MTSNPRYYDVTNPAKGICVIKKNTSSEVIQHKLAISTQKNKTIYINKIILHRTLHMDNYILAPEVMSGGPPP